MQGIVIKRIRDISPEFPQVWQLREDVLRKPLGLTLKNENLDDDKLDTICIALHNAEVIGCVMMHPLNNTEIKLRQMAVHEDWQGKGIGKRLVEDAEKYAWENGYKKIALHARILAQGFYTRMGYTTTSAVFTEVNVPHVVMEKLKEKQV